MVTTKDPIFRLIPITAIKRDDSTNTRSYMDSEALEDLKSSIREHGVQQNVAVGPEENGEFPLIWGFRRHTASMAIMDELEGDDSEEAHQVRLRVFEIPAKVLTAEEIKKAKELQLIENLQRQDVDPVDEARGYHFLLLEKHADGAPVYTIERLAKVLGIPKKGADYIRHRLKLLNAPDELLEAIRCGQVPSVRVGEMIGRIPNEKLRVEAAKRAIKDKYTNKALTVLEVSAMIKSDYCASLRGVDFDLDSEDLLTKDERIEFEHFSEEGELTNGSCTACPHRTANDPSLTGKLAIQEGGVNPSGTSGVDPFVCQNTKCFQKKLSNAWRVVEKAAEANGMRVMAADKAKELFKAGALDDKYRSQYIVRSERPDYQCTGHMAEETMPTWDELLDGSGVSWIIARAPNKKLVHLLERDTAVHVVEQTSIKKGLPNPFLNRPGKAQIAQRDTPSTPPPPRMEQPKFKVIDQDEQDERETTQNDQPKVAGRNHEQDRLIDFHAKRMIYGDLMDKLSLERMEPSALRTIIQNVRLWVGDDHLLGAALGLWMEPVKDAKDWVMMGQDLEAKLQTMDLPPRTGIGVLLVILLSDVSMDEDQRCKILTDLGIDVKGVEQMALQMVKGSEDDRKTEPKQEAPQEKSDAKPKAAKSATGKASKPSAKKPTKKAAKRAGK